jgi:hypothetical protein
VSAQLGLATSFEQRRDCAHVHLVPRIVSTRKVLTCKVGSEILFWHLLRTALPWRLKRNAGQ